MFCPRSSGGGAAVRTRAQRARAPDAGEAGAGAGGVRQGESAHGPVVSSSFIISNSLLLVIFICHLLDKENLLMGLS